MNHSKVFRSGPSRLFGVLAMGALLSACLNPQTSVKSAAELGLVAGKPAGSGSVSGGASFAFGAVSKVVTNLGASAQVTVNLTGAPGFVGSVPLAVDSSEIHLIDPGKYVSLTVSPPVANLANGNTVPVTVTIKVDTMAPDFDLHFHLIAQEIVNNLPIVANLEVPFQVMPVYNVNVFGGPVQENWNGSTISTPLSFRAHPGGLTYNFINFDSAAQHTIHSSNSPIPHQNTATPLTQALNGVPQAGGTYSYVVMPGIEVTDSYYCHIHESATQTRTATFNKGAANATFTYVNMNIIQPMCIQCHGAANPSGGIALDTYAHVLNVVTSKNPASSPLFTSVNNETMPQNSGPLTAVQKLAIMDWINAGAPNN